LDDAKKRQLLDDLKRLSAEEVLLDGSTVRFEIAGYTRPPYHGQRLLPVQGMVLDADGETVSVLLHEDENGRIYELELVRYANGNVLGPDWATLKLISTERHHPG
jgi:hypothetical protein